MRRALSLEDNTHDVKQCTPFDNFEWLQQHISVEVTSLAIFAKKLVNDQATEVCQY